MSTVKVTNIQNASSATVNMVTDTTGNVSFGGTAVMSSSYTRNRIINGNMVFDQRNLGATQTFTAAAALAYSVDRWYGYCTGANVTGTRITGATANQYRYQFTGAASVTAIGFGQRIEAINSADLAGTTATLSVVLANSLLTSVTWTAYYANTTDTFGSLASPTVTSIATGTFTVTSTATQYSVNIAIPSAATTGIQILFTVGAQTSGTWTIGNVQLEAGSVATPFEWKSYVDTATQCYRYYYRITPAKVSGILGTGDVNTTSAFRMFSQLPVPMRIQPTTLEQSGTASDYAVRTGATITVCTSVPTFTGIAGTNPTVVGTTLTTGATLVVAQAGDGRLSASVSTGYLGWPAEL